MKKIFAMLLSLVMILSLSVPAFAAEITSTEEGSNTASKDVTASYTPSGSDEDPAAAVITGLYITVDGVTYSSTNTSAETPATIYSDSTVTVTLMGENFENVLPYEESQIGFTYLGSNNDKLFADSEWIIDAVNNTATKTADIEYLANATSASELKYTNDGWITDDGSGVFVIYDEGTNPDTEDTAEITGVSIQVGGTTYTEGTVTLTPDSGDVTIIVHGTDLQNGTIDNLIWYANGRNQPLVSGYNWNVSANGTEASTTFSISHFEITTTAHEIQYSNDGEQTWTGSGVYVLFQSETVSVDITWGAMSFTYDDTVAEGATEETGWTCADGANKITVANSGTVSVNAAVAYAPADGYSAITGKFQDVNEAEVTDADISAGGSYDFYLILSGKPEAAITAGTKIGEVTITIEPVLDITISEVTDETALDIMLGSLATALDSGVTNIAIDMGENYYVGEYGPEATCFDIRINATIVNSNASEGSVNLTLKGTNAGRIWLGYGENTKLKTVTLPDATLIASECFKNCTNLTAVYVPNATSIGKGIFSGCTSLTTVELTAAGTFSVFEGTWDSMFGCDTSNVNLVLNADKESSVTINDDGTAAWNGMTFKSITFVD